jgi:protein O-GlcNAc transferase
MTKHALAAIQKIPAKVFNRIKNEFTFQKVISQNPSLAGILKYNPPPNAAIFREIKRVIARTASQRPMPQVYNEIADFLLNIGLPTAAKPYYQMSLKLDWTPDTHSLYLQCLLMDPACDDEQMFAEATRYNDFFSDIKKTDSHTNLLDPKKKLNVGYICHFFHNCVSQSLLIPFLKAHNRERVKVFCYSDTETNEVDAAIKSIADVWRDTKNLDHETLSSQIKNDQIDILLELNGHCIMNRYAVIARKPAPVQISFYNQCGTTGISAFDYALVGDENNLEKSAPYYSEEIYYVKGVTGISIFPDHFPAVSPPPCLSKGYITFGSFGAAHKVNVDVVKMWCKVLKRVPNSRFFMKAGVLSHPAFLNAYKQWFKNEGISLDRIHFEGHSEHHKMLECYSRMDIALDTFPYTAGTTTMEASWQGVPVITLTGDKYCSQNGKVITSSMGHPELIAYSEQEYINKAVELANDKERLIYYRNNLRNDYRNSPRADAKAYAEKLEDAYVDMWKKYCESQV